ncbi:MAG: JAB domain-containing protein [Allosphingosinicella sp.]|uniref:JAB domain-containing protein n=1 Tax=Allosphingosinicella sp. TaxID=2823234 RepID=UPI00394D97A0
MTRLIDSARPGRGRDAARALLRRYGSLGAVAAAPAEALAEAAGCARAAEQVAAAAAMMRAALKAEAAAAPIDPDAPAFRDYLQAAIGWLAAEQFRVFYLDGHGRLIAEALIASGTAGEVEARPRDVIGRALALDAAALILAHNHPDYPASITHAHA